MGWFLEFLLYYKLEQLFVFLEEFWAETFSAMNPGQQVIFEYDMLEVINEFLVDCMWDWPWVDPFNYGIGLFAAYDIEVMWRAFSNAILISEIRVAELVFEAQEIAYLLDALAF